MVLLQPSYATDSAWKVPTLAWRVALFRITGVICFLNGRRGRATLDISQHVIVQADLTPTTAPITIDNFYLDYSSCLCGLDLVSVLDLGGRNLICPFSLSAPVTTGRIIPTSIEPPASFINAPIGLDDRCYQIAQIILASTTVDCFIVAIHSWARGGSRFRNHWTRLAQTATCDG